MESPWHESLLKTSGMLKKKYIYVYRVLKMWCILNAYLEQINSFNTENIKIEGKTSFGDYVQSPAWKPRGRCGIIEKKIGKYLERVLEFLACSNFPCLK